MREHSVPLLARVVGVNPDHAAALEIISQNEFDHWIAPALLDNRRPSPLQGTKLAKAIYVNRTTLNEKYTSLGPAVKSVAALMPILLGARGDLFQHPVWFVEEVSSPVGESMSAEGIAGITTDLPGASRFQRLFGMMICGREVAAHATLEPVIEGINAYSYTEWIITQFESLSGLAQKLREHPWEQEREALCALGLEPSALLEYLPPHVILIPRLDVGEYMGDGHFEGLVPDLNLLRDWIARRSGDVTPPQAVVEVADNPFDHDLRWLDRVELHEYLGWAYRRSPLAHLELRGVYYAIERRRGEIRVHRYVDAQDAAGEEDAVALQISVAAFGFPGEGEPGHREGLALVLAHCEKLAARPSKAHAERLGRKLAPSYSDPEAAEPNDSAERLGANIAPSLTQVQKDDARAFICNLRLQSHTLVSAALHKRRPPAND